MFMYKVTKSYWQNKYFVQIYAVSIFVISFLITWHHCLKKALSKLVNVEMVFTIRNRLPVVLNLDYIIVIINIKPWIQDQPVL